MKKLFGLLMVFTFAFSLAGCQPAATPTAVVQPATAVIQPTETAVPAATAQPQVVTIKFLGAQTTPEGVAGMNKMIAAFEAENPNIKIQMENMQGSDLDAIAATLLTTSTGPDVVVRNPGPGYAGVWARAGQLLVLDKYAQQYKWADRIFPIGLAQATFDGHVYGIANSYEYAGLFWNKDLFSKLGLTVPTSYEDILTLCKTAQASGLHAIAFADKDQWEGSVVFATILSNMIGGDGIDNILHGNGRWDTPEVIKSLQLAFVDMVKAGCYAPDPLSLEWEDGNTLFWNGKTLMEPTGTWLISEIPSTFNAGFMFFPAVPGGAGIFPASDLGGGYWINAKTQHPDEAAKWLDFMFSTEAAKIWYEDLSTVPPVNVDTSTFKLNPLLSYSMQIIQNQKTGYNFDPLMPANFVTAEGAGFQAIILGEKTPEQLAAELEKAWEDALASGQTVK
jgi:raffinose/stachyose/melibiose transport system substrate-binding protein